MIDQADRQLKAWINGLLGDAILTFGPPERTPSGPGVKDGVSCYLLSLDDKPPERAPQRAPLQITLCYLITTCAETPEQAHRLLGQLVFAAMQVSDWEVELQLIPPGYWEALGAPPQPCFILRVPLRMERPAPPVQRVRKPLEVMPAPVRSLSGIVLGPGDIPIAGAAIRLPFLNISTASDAAGRFVIPAVPATDRAWRLHVRAKGKDFDIEAVLPAADLEPVIIRLEAFD